MQYYYFLYKNIISLEFKKSKTNNYHKYIKKLIK